ncbi:MAG: hypothetical protein HFF25_03730 [Oscillospiraceae bacterium]|jgi:hypothetical protein|nr:hypothetical protein [Oscillospiraceae bacterium]
MCITKAQIGELNTIIDRLNAIDSVDERMEYLESQVEDADFFLEVLKKVNRNNLRLKNSRGVSDAKKTKYTFQAADVLARFQSNSVESIAADSSKEELIAMYHTIFHAKPLSSFNKMRIAQTINSYIHDMNRFDALLG